jgi:hypothetical protein
MVEEGLSSETKAIRTSLCIGRRWLNERAFSQLASVTSRFASLASAPQDAQNAPVAELRTRLAEMRSQRDARQGIAERLALSAPKPPEPKPEARRPWWRRLPKSKDWRGDPSALGGRLTRIATALRKKGTSITRDRTGKMRKEPTPGTFC